MPLVSVIMSVYNGEKYIDMSLNSILGQTFEDFEFLVMNDGSTDNTAAILKECARRDKRLKIYSQENKGLNQSLNSLIQVAKGKYLARMDADDISEPDRLALQVEYMENHPACAFLVGGSLVIDEHSRVINGKYLRNDEPRLRSILFSGRKNPFTHGSIMFRKEHLMELSLIYRFKFSQDLDLLMRLALRHKIGALEKIVYRYREGSSLQNDFGLNLKRQEQCSFLLQAIKSGKLFDDSYCITSVNAIYSSQSVNGYSNEDITNFEINKTRVELKKLFLAGNKKQLRNAVKNNVARHGINKVYAFYYLTLFLPLALSYSLVDFFIILRNYFINDCTKKLTLRELARYNLR